MYRAALQTLDRVVPVKYHGFLNHPAGPKTVHFWAPLWKWALVIAGIGDATRPPEKLSIPQSGALACTGLIWARYSLIIIPKNYSLFLVNCFVGLTGSAQLTRAYLYQQSLKQKGAGPGGASGDAAAALEALDVAVDAAAPVKMGKV